MSRGAGLYLRASEDEVAAIRGGLPSPYAAPARAILLAVAGRWDMVPEELRPWVRGALRAAARGPR